MYILIINVDVNPSNKLHCDNMTLSYIVSDSISETIH